MSEVKQNERGGRAASDNSELLECPFCGSKEVEAGEALIKGSGDKLYSQAGCTNCGALGPVKPIDYGNQFRLPARDAKSTLAWNTRPL